jgi:hypothetical protein
MREVDEEDFGRGAFRIGHDWRFLILTFSSAEAQGRGEEDGRLNPYPILRADMSGGIE